MAWIEVHQTLQRHPKLLRLSAKLRIHRAQSAGHLLFLWLWTLDYSPTGDLSAFGPAEISAAAEYPGDAEIFSQALRETGWIDPSGCLHDWYDYAGKLIEKREADRERKAEERKKSAVHGTSKGQPRDGAGTVPNPTVPNPTLKPESVRASRFAPPTPQEVSDYCRERGNQVDPEKFMAYYESNGWKVGRNPMKDWKAAIRTWEKGSNNGNQNAGTSQRGTFGTQSGGRAAAAGRRAEKAAGEYAEDLSL